MFGYVHIVKDELLVKEYNTFRAYYCGLCRELGRVFGQKSRLGLSYDMVFLALVLDSLNAEVSVASPIFCVLHPVKKRWAAPTSTALNYAAYMSVLLSQSKIEDDMTDDGKSLKTVLGSWIYRRPARKARRAYAIVSKSITDHLARLSALEKQKCACIDEVAHEFGEIMRALFTPDFVPGTARQDLSALAYQLGRWIYLLDAIDDIGEDAKKSHYNPLFYQFHFSSETETKETFTLRVQQSMQESLDHTLAQMALLYERIPFQKNKGILFNIFYLGMPKMQRQILERNMKSYEQPLSNSGCQPQRNR